MPLTPDMIMIDLNAGHALDYKFLMFMFSRWKHEQMIEGKKIPVAMFGLCDRLNLPKTRWPLVKPIKHAMFIKPPINIDINRPSFRIAIKVETLFTTSYPTPSPSLLLPEAVELHQVRLGIVGLRDYLHFWMGFHEHWETVRDETSRRYFPWEIELHHTFYWSRSFSGSTPEEIERTQHNLMGAFHVKET